MPSTRRRVKQTTIVSDGEQLRRGQKRIAESTLPLFLCHGYHACTVRDIARESGMSVGAIFNYFPSKEDILFYLLNVLHGGIEEALAGARIDFQRHTTGKGSDPVEAFTELYDRYARSVYDLRAYLLLGYQETKSLSREHRHRFLEREREMQSFLAELITYGVERGVFDCEKRDIRGYAHSLQLLAQAWAIRRWALETFTDFPEYLEFLRRAVMRLLGASSREERRLSSEWREGRLKRNEGRR